MRVIKLFVLVSLFVVICISSVFAQVPQTPAEISNFQTPLTKYNDVLDYVYTLEAKSDNMYIQKFTETLMGRDLILCVLSNPPVYKASDVINSNKPIVLIVNNVHGGEIAGKEASLILMRDLLFGEYKSLLDEVVVLIVPTVNPDGAEVRRRTNEQGYDMNRDYLKLETQEINALITKVINVWQPDLHVDTHHGGSAPYTLTYQTNMNPAGDKELMRLGNDIILPRVREALRKEDYDGFWYSGPRKVNGVDGWSPTSVEPRKQHVYSTLANMVGFLFETPRGTHRVVDNGSRVVEVPRDEIFKHQVRGEYIGLLEMIKFAADEPILLRNTVSAAKKRATILGNDDSDDDQIVLDYEQVENFKTDIWIDKNRTERGAPRQQGERRVPEFELVNRPVFTKWTPTKTTTRPWGYVLPPQMASVVQKLLEHGISVKRMKEPVKLDVEAYYATKVDNSEYFQGHYLKKVEAVKRNESKDFPKGSFFVPAGQPKSNLICYLLEPETNDNMITWSFLDTQLRALTPEQQQRQEEMMARYQGRSTRRAPGQLIPIYRLMKKAEIKGTLVKDFNSFDRNRYIK